MHVYGQLDTNTTPTHPSVNSRLRFWPHCSQQYKIISRSRLASLSPARREVAPHRKGLIIVVTCIPNFRTARRGMISSAHCTLLDHLERHGHCCTLLSSSLLMVTCPRCASQVGFLKHECPRGVLPGSGGLPAYFFYPELTTTAPCGQGDLMLDAGNPPHMHNPAGLYGSYTLCLTPMHCARYLVFLCWPMHVSL
jgi:hypothetical protein